MNDNSLTLTVHHLSSSQSFRILWLCEELGIHYNLIRYEREASGAAPPAYKALHKCGTAPVITDGDVALPESGAIVEYLIAKYGNGRLAVAAERPNFSDYLFWFHFANASMMSCQLVGVIADTLRDGEKSDIVYGMLARCEVAFSLVEERLATVDYFAGSELTAADIMMIYQLTTMRRYVPKDLGPYPHTRAYLQRIGARPAYQRSVEKSYPDMAPLLE